MKITSESQFSRRKVLGGMLAAGAGFPATANAGWFSDLFGGGSDDSTKKPSYDPKYIEGISTFKQYHDYSNMYEFGTSKADPGRKEHLASHLLEDWAVDFNGTIMDIDTLMGVPFSGLKEEIFDFRCVEAWGMRVHYNGMPLSELIKKFGDTSKKYVAFTSKVDDAYPGQGRFSTLDWPYREALTMEEAMNPLCWAVFGNYGVQSIANGAPFRINIPWKYGFKSPKAVVKVEFLDEMPPSTWNRLARREYGWYSNVYPKLSHPRWSQASHRMITEDGTETVDTLRYNGYEEQVAHLYKGDDRQYF